MIEKLTRSLGDLFNGAGEADSFALDGFAKHSAFERTATMTPDFFLVRAAA